MGFGDIRVTNRAPPAWLDRQMTNPIARLVRALRSLDDITNKEAGVTRGADDLNARQAAAFIHAALSGYFRKRLMMPCASNDAEIGQIVAIALRCIDSESIGHAACIEP